MKAKSNFHIGAAVSELSFCAIFLLSAEGHILSWNRGARQIKGWEEEDISGFHFSIFYDDKERAQRLPETCLEIALERGRYTGEGWRLRQDGSVFRASVEIEYLHPKENDQAAFIKIVRDITQSYGDRMAASIELETARKKNDDLTAVSQCLDEMFDHSPCGLIICNVNTGDILRANLEATQLPYLEKIISKGNIRSRHIKDTPINLLTFFTRALKPNGGEKLNDKISFLYNDLEFSVKIVAEPLRNNALRNYVMFTLLDVSAEHQAIVNAKHQALHDPLTGLLNRRGLMSSLSEYLNKETGFAVMIFDLDKFKDVNDVLGHLVGDALLKESSSRLIRTLRVDDILARTGGDEFVAVCSGITTAEAASEIALRLTSVLRDPFIFDGKKVISGCSIGLFICVEEKLSPEEILSAADIALYEAKLKGGNRYVLFSDTLAAKTKARFSLENDLRNALANNELEILYQPIVDSGTKKVVVLEALLRWRHPVRGNVPPSLFIPVAEETGLIHDIGAFVLNQACADAAKSFERKRVAVNLSPKQFRDPQLAKRVEYALEKSALPPNMLELEITESAILEDREGSFRTIQNFRALGICIVLDDFGTGFFSLDYLRTKLFNKIKIDKSFVDDLLLDENCAAIVGSILLLCRQLGLMVTAEGIERQEQADWLMLHGCGFFQGYLFGEPAPHQHGH